MARFKVARPNQDVNLREWEPGRVAQLKLFLGHLENAVNTSLAAQVSQSPKREFSEFVPVVVPQDIEVQIEFRELRLQWEHPKGLKDFLFYEVQISTTERFFQFDQSETSIPSFVFPDLLDSTTYFVRLRVVTKNGRVGPWSVPVSATTPFAQAFGVRDSFSDRVLIGTENFVPIMERQYNAIGGTAYYAIDYDIEVNIQNDTVNNVEWSDVELKWLVDGNQIGQAFRVTSYGTNNTTVLGSDMEVKTQDIGSFPGDSLFIPGRFTTPKRGTFVQKLTNLSEGSHTFYLMARKLPASIHPTSNDFYFNAAVSSPGYGANSVITLKNFHAFEVLS